MTEDPIDQPPLPPPVDDRCAYPAYCSCCDVMASYRAGLTAAQISARWAAHVLEVIQRAQG